MFEGFRVVKPLPGWARLDADGRSRGLAARPALSALGADDAIHALAVQLLGDEGEAQLLSDCAGEEASHRVLLPSRLLHDRRDRGPLRPAQQRNHVGLLGTGARSGRFISPALSRAGYLRGFAPAYRRGGQLLGRVIRPLAGSVLDPDGVKALLGDAQGARTVAITSPDGEGAARLDLLDKAFSQELGHDLGAPRQICGPFKGTVVALRCRRQQHQLGIGQFHGILHSVTTAIAAAPAEAPQWR